MIYDTAIIGTGPAGVSAALNLKIHEKNFVWFGSKNLSDKITKAEQISNYPGFIRVTGRELNEAFQKQIKEMQIEIIEEMVNSILTFRKRYAIMAGNQYFEAKTIILATGTASGKTLPGEEELVGKGISYCATCDGELYRNREIAVLCNNPRFEHEVKYLADLASKVYYFPMYRQNGIQAENVKIMEDYPKSFQKNGERLESVELRSGKELKVDGVFCLRDTVAMTTLLPKVELEDGHIFVDRHMATNLPGIYCAGDCTGRPYQYAKAVGEGNVAAHQVIEYLAEQEE